MKTKTKILVTLLSIFVILAGMMDMPANTYTPTGNTSATRFGYELPGYMDGLVARWYTNPCTNLEFYAGNSDGGTNVLNVLFYRNGALIKNKAVTAAPWESVYIVTDFEFDTVVFLNGDNAKDVIQVAWCWWHY